MSSLILYKSKHGAAMQYAQWIHETVTGSEIASVDGFDTNKLAGYEKIVIVSATYMGDIKAREFLVTNWNKMQDKKIYLLAVGMVFSEDAQKTYEKIPMNIRNAITYSKVPGRIEYDKLNFFEKLITKMFGIKNIDKTDRKQIRAVVEFLS